MKELRIQKIIADSLCCSRRKAEDIIKNNIVTCNNKQVKLGDKASLKDTIYINNIKLNLKMPTKKIYIMLNKPRGYITTLSDEKNRKTILDLISSKIKERVYPIGRLDKNSQGLLLLTNDGDFCNSIIHPKYKIKKTYIVTINKELQSKKIKELEDGVLLEGKKTHPCKIEIILNSPQKSKFKIEIHEGRNRQIRKMVEEILKAEVKRLKRIKIGSIKLKNLPVGKFRNLTEKELESLKKLNSFTI